MQGNLHEVLIEERDGDFLLAYTALNRAVDRIGITGAELFDCKFPCIKVQCQAGLAGGLGPRQASAKAAVPPRRSPRRAYSPLSLRLHVGRGWRSCLFL